MKKLLKIDLVNFWSKYQGLFSMSFSVDSVRLSRKNQQQQPSSSKMNGENMKTSALHFQVGNIFILANRNQKLLRASAWETGADLEMKVGRFCLKLVHKVVMWTYVICQSFSLHDLFPSEFWISAP